MLRYLTAGESHGQALTAIVEGFPSGVRVDTAVIDRELERRQGGYGRGKRQKLETDRVIVDAGIFHGETTGGPITLRLVNNDAKLERLQEPSAAATRRRRGPHPRQVYRRVRDPDRPAVPLEMKRTETIVPCSVT